MVETVMEDQVLTDEEQDLIRHALGWTQKTVAYRNHYNTGLKGDDFRAWQRLVEKGFAVRWAKPGIPGWLFAVGMRAAEMVKRAARRERIASDLRTELERIQILLDKDSVVQHRS